MDEKEVREIARWRERVRFTTRPVEAIAKGDFKGTLAGPRTVQGVADYFELEIGDARSAARALSAPRPREEIETGIKPDDLPESFLDPRRWELVVAGAWRDPGRTHELEARTSSGYDAPLEILNSTARCSCRPAIGAACAFEKGRATSLELLAHCRSIVQPHRLAARSDGGRGTSSPRRTSRTG